MKKLFLFLLSFILLIGIIVSFIVIYFLKTFDANKIVSIASNEFEKNYGLKIIATNSYFDINKGLAVNEFKVVNISNNAELFTSEKFFLTYDPSYLIKEKKLKISKIGFFRAFSSFENLTNLIGKFNSKPQENSIIKIEISAISFEDSMLEYRKKKVSVSGGVTFLKKSTNYKIKAGYKDTELDFEGDFDSGKVRLKNFRFKDWVEFESPIYVENTSFKFKDLHKLYQLDLDYFEGKFNERLLSVKKPFRLKISNNFKGFDVENLEITYNNENNFSIVKAFYLSDKDFFLDVSKSNFKLEEFFKGVHGNVSGNFSYNSRNEIPIMGNIKIKEFEYQGIKNFEGELQLDNESFVLKGSGYFNGVGFSIDANSKEVNKRNLYASLNIPVLEPEKLKFQTSFSSRMNLEKTPFNFLTFHVNIGKLIFKNLEFKNVIISGDADSERINILNASGEIFSGKITGSGFLEGGILNLKVNYDKGKLNEFSDLYLKENKKLYGTISMEGWFTMKPFIFSTIDGTIKGVINYGELENIFIQNKLNEFLSDIPLDHVYFDKITFEFGVRDSKLRINSFEFKSSKINSTLKGEYSISTDLISLTMFLSFSKNYLKDIPNIANLLIKGRNRENWVDFSLFIEGNSKNLKFTFLEVQ